MAIYCYRCKQALGFRKRKSRNYFINENNDEIVLCTNCYFDLPKDEKKKLIHTGEQNISGKYRPDGLAFGVLGSGLYSDGYNSGMHSSLNRRMRKKGLTQQQVDELSIDMFNAHWDFLTIDAKEELLKEDEENEEDEYEEKTYRLGRLIGLKNYKKVEKKKL